jgi:Raf kinase inhibitor-like YbhB/YbcL family protein/uncharacterized protein (TIGR00297 family)
MLLQILLGFGLALLVSLAAWRARALTPGGAAAALGLGTLVFGLGGLAWAVLLLGFFISSSVLSRAFRRRKATVEEKFSKGSQRDAGQVLANGGVAGLFTLLHLLFPLSGLPFLAFAGTLAAVNADTWATELGVLSRRPPFLISTGKAVERGASGGISPAGLLAALGGAVLIAGLAALPALHAAADTGRASSTGRVFIILGVVTLAGLAGSLVDSLLGATLQVIYTCPTCAKETECHPIHTCGTATVYQRGWRWLNNDWVNAACAMAGAGLALAASPLFFGQLGHTAPAKESIMTAFPLSSPAFTQGSLIPKQFTCDGANISPALNWSGLPPGALSLALITDDPDAPGGTFTHWVLYNMSPSLTGLPEAVTKTTQAPGIGTHGNNSFGRPGYGGPCPPRGAPHRYYFTLYALDLPPDLPPGLTSTKLQSAMHGHILAEGQWMGKYQR